MPHSLLLSAKKEGVLKTEKNSQYTIYNCTMISIIQLEFVFLASETQVF